MLFQRHRPGIELLLTIGRYHSDGLAPISHDDNLRNYLRLNHLEKEHREGSELILNIGRKNSSFLIVNNK